MTFHQFKALDVEEQYIFWLAKAVEVANYEANGYLHVLYQLDKFYIEMRLKKEHPDRVWLEAFAEEYLLQPYLNTIDITEII